MGREERVEAVHKISINTVNMVPINLPSFFAAIAAAPLPASSSSA